MAKWCAALVVALAAAAGCQSQSGMLVKTLPPPNFNGPSLPEPRPAPGVVQAPPQLAPPAPLAPAHRAVRPAPGVPAEWLPAAPKAGGWRYIVIHHSATHTGGAGTFDKMHRGKGWDELGYHFVVGNGTDTRDGSVEVGPRWSKQKWGAHTKTPDNRYNDFGIGICLVGNYDVARPTAGQIQSTARLVAHLMRTYHVPPDQVIGHGTVKPTDCPGRNLSVASVKRMSLQILAESGKPLPADTRSAALPSPAGLLYDVPAR